MGSGEYGGNGSVHWHISNERDRNHGKGHHKYEEVDEFPSDTEKGDFVVEVFDIGQGNITFDKNQRLLTVRFPIKHGNAFTRQVRVSWPDPEGTTPEGPAMAPRSTAISRGTAAFGGTRKRTATARKK
jgi:hypothetical protein